MDLGGGGGQACSKLNRNGVFTVCSYYEALKESVTTNFPWKAIWRVKAPFRVAFFVWMTSSGKNLTINNLIK
jgi:hypothetical protein